MMDLYRGAQPNEQGLEELKKLGITTIVDLRAEDRGKSEWEKTTSRAPGHAFRAHSHRRIRGAYQ